MRATISGIESGGKFTDGEMRVTLRFVEADRVYNELRFPLSKLGLSGTGSGPFLDQEVEVTLSVPKVKK
jgi:hypothetical protein